MHIDIDYISARNKVLTLETISELKHWHLIANLWATGARSPIEVRQARWLRIHVCRRIGLITRYVLINQKTAKRTGTGKWDRVLASCGFIWKGGVAQSIKRWALVPQDRFDEMEKDAVSKTCYICKWRLSFDHFTVDTDTNVRIGKIIKAKSVILAERIFEAGLAVQARRLLNGQKTRPKLVGKKSA